MTSSLIQQSDECSDEEATPYETGATPAGATLTYSDRLTLATDELHLVYHAARVLRTKGMEHSKECREVTGMDGTDLMPSASMASVPDLLYNFLA